MARAYSTTKAIVNMAKVVFSLYTFLSFVLILIPSPPPTPNTQPLTMKSENSVSTGGLEEYCKGSPRGNNKSGNFSLTLNLVTLHPSKWNLKSERLYFYSILQFLKRVSSETWKQAKHEKIVPFIFGGECLIMGLKCFFKGSNTSFEFLEFVASDKVTFRKYHHFHTPLNCSTIFYTNKLLFLEFPLKYAELGELNWIEQNWCFKISSCSIKLQSFYRKITRNHMMIIFSSGCLKKLFNFVEGLKKISGIFHKGEAWFSTKNKKQKKIWA